MTSVIITIFFFNFIHYFSYLDVATVYSKRENNNTEEVGGINMATSFWYTTSRYGISIHTAT
ncbi:MAG: hypothetical protein RBQ79_07335 [Sphaerochaetaceae bacterium]|nr:hypothetical protein [Sphaerochaetaceae bacterium]